MLILMTADGAPDVDTGTTTVDDDHTHVSGGSVDILLDHFHDGDHFETHQHEANDIGPTPLITRAIPHFLVSSFDFRHKHDTRGALVKHHKDDPDDVLAAVTKHSHVDNRNRDGAVRTVTVHAHKTADAGDVSTATVETVSIDAHTHNSASSGSRDDWGECQNRYRCMNTLSQLRPMKLPEQVSSMRLLVEAHTHYSVSSTTQDWGDVKTVTLPIHTTQPLLRSMRLLLRAHTHEPADDGLGDSKIVTDHQHSGKAVNIVVDAHTHVGGEHTADLDLVRLVARILMMKFCLTSM